MKETFGEYIRSLRINSNFTLTQLGGKLGIDSGSLSKIETNKKEFDEIHLLELAKIFDLDYEILKSELISEKIAKSILINNCSEDVLTLAKDKVKYIKQRFVKQTKLKI